MARMLKAELNTNLLLLNNQQLSALYFMKQRPPPPTIPRTPGCPYLTRVSVVSSGGVSPPTASLHILLPVIRMLSCPAQPSAYGLLPPTLPAPNPTRVRNVRIAFYCFVNCPADSPSVCSFWPCSSAVCGLVTGARVRRKGGGHQHRVSCSLRKQQLCAHILRPSPRSRAVRCACGVFAELGRKETTFVQQPALRALDID